MGAGGGGHSPHCYGQVEVGPAGVHGAERTRQMGLITALKPADFLGSRELLLAWLLGTTVQVILMEVSGQALQTWDCGTWSTSV